MTSSTHLTLDEARRISEMAFLPYRGETRADDGDASYSLQIIDQQQRTLLTIAHIARSQYSDPVHLAGVLEHARLELSKDGHALAPWSLPGQPGVADR